MRIDPIYLVAPLPAPKTMLARRAFLLAGAAGVAGIAVGGSAAILWLPGSTTNAPTLFADLQRDFTLEHDGTLAMEGKSRAQQAYEHRRRGNR